MKEKTVGSTTSPKLRISIGKWYIEIGKTLAVFHTFEELAEAMKELWGKEKNAPTIQE